MIEAILRFSIRQRGLVVALSLLFVFLGLLAARELSIDAVPDITNRQVQLNAVSPSLGPEEMERRVTFPLEMALAGLPKIQEVRSISQFGLSQLTAVFDDDVDIYRARQWVSERIQEARESLPPGVTTEMSPVSSGLGEILYLRLHNPALTLMERRSLLDWVVRPQLRSIPGLAEINTWGGQVRQLQLSVDPERLRRYSLSLEEVIRAVERNNANGGGAFIEQADRQRVVQVTGVLRGIQDLRQVSVLPSSGPPLLLSQLGTVEEGPMIRQGAVTQDGQGEECYAICMLLLGENGSRTIEEIKRRLPWIEKSLPPGTTLEPFLDRSRLIQATLRTASTNLAEGGLLVVGLLFLFLLQLRAGLIVSSVIPLAMLFAVLGMRYFGISANLMSLGAIDFGIVVDGSVIIVENCVRRLSLRREQLDRALTEEERIETLTSACVEVRSATQFGELLVLSSFLPILALEGIEGKMFRPMGWTVILALLGAMILAFTLIPALCAFFLKPEREPHHPMLERLSRAYAWLLAGALRKASWVVLGSLMILLLGIGAFTSLGSEFIPELEEGALAVQLTYPAGVTLEESIRLSTAVEKQIHRVCGEQVKGVVTRIGRPEIATDPMLPCQTDVIVDLAPGANQVEVSRALRQLFQDSQGVEVSFTQPIKMRMNELIEGVGIRADLGIKIFGQDHGELARLGDRVADLLRQVRGAVDVTVETTEGLASLQIDLDRQQLALTGTTVEDVNLVVEAAVGCRPISSVNDGNQRYDLVVRLPEALRNDSGMIGSLLIVNSRGESFPLRQLARIVEAEGPMQISREDGKRRVVVQSNVEGRDLGGFVQEVEALLGRELRLPTGYYLRYAGTYEKLESGRARLLVVVPLTLAGVFAMLLWTFGSWRLAALVFSGLPLAMTGGALALAFRGMNLSISAGIGFIALSGVAVLNGLVMLVFIEQLRSQGLDWRQAVLRGSEQRLRPILMTALTTAVGFLPMALSTGAGAEVQRPLATVVIGGMFTSTLLSLFLLPTLYALTERQSHA